MSEETVLCRTPNPDRPGTTRIPRWKFDLLRTAVLDLLQGGEVRFSDLSGLVKRGLGASDLNNLGSITWHVTTVKLELEVRGEIERVPGSGPQRLRLSSVD